ncbi:uncharacterized protein BDW43DRAFT_310792 [Aspergillus alliaceus]|uniref:uncharacterized protein n=1 Tax=Petromyces alliaceus TaxID=209559 RepID=UPI0012A65809|nr:uncharacterized protein BDW43DRAFT_310792 [Aspergillus alliaceus]KAB8233783.1 hypothetical protein BDW43DRAFT_310792 [Aspergillus alliaceus]
MASSWFPSPRRENRGKRAPQEKRVDELVYKYYKISRPNTNDILRDILKSPEQSSLLFSALRRQVSLIKCRSQAFEDGQITTYDRALVKLSRDGENLTDTGALELYLTEYLGIVPMTPVCQGKDILARHLELESVLRKASAPSTMSETVVPKREEPPETISNGQMSIQSEYELGDPDDLFVPEDPDWNMGSISHTQQVLDRVGRLLDVYNGAKDEYYKALQTEGYVSIDNARFLRDTAENALRYLQANGMSDHTSVLDLEQIFKTARDKATELTGGRKRHFDEGAERLYRRRKRRTVDSYRPKK